ncbi:MULTISPECIES: VOC family protein [Sphingobium]|uniref:VOC family protein n=1 Tax=Sphingobium TaxID=165695 RepID=UPI00159C7EA3|nr:VOC family protein [Sphingobium sp. 15-1]
MNGVTELGYLVLGVKDMPRWRAYAGDFLGLEVVDGETSAETFLRMDFWHHRLILEEDSLDDVTALGLRVADEEEFEKMARRLNDAGVRHRICSKEEAQARRVLRLMKLEDPDGHPIEIFHGPLVEFNKPFHSGRRMYGQFVTGAAGLGHCQIAGANIPEFLSFYRLLGMQGDVEYKAELSPGKVTELAFVHTTGRERQHVIAYGLPGTKRMNHIMFESNSIDDLIYTYELAQSMDIPIVLALGRHSNDHQYSFYCASPSGYMIEYGWGSRPATVQTEYYSADFYGHQLLTTPPWNQ